MTVNAAFDAGELTQFKRAMVDTYDYSAADLDKLFEQAEYRQKIIDAISRPAERLPWHKYKNIFLQEDRIAAGVDYWKTHADTLARAEQEYGVPAEIIVAIIGVETRYGRHAGNYRVVDALATLGFNYPPRAKFFRQELEQYLILTREQSVDPLSIKGSYAGAMGIPQFISSSYRNYAIDFNDDGQIDLWNDHVDAIGSVANYFSRHGWRPGEPVIYKTIQQPDDAKKWLSEGLKPDRQFAELCAAGFEVDARIDDAAAITVLRFEQSDAEEIWLGRDNFYVITRYNHSPLYALAVYKLAQAIKSRR
ncbi:MAG: lytic murein transglycosylase B [Gammaproteobacteria bacterium]